MIKLAIEDYCHNCNNFKPEITVGRWYDGGTDTVILCEHKDVCDNIKWHIENGRKEHER